jgi:hypothetical protein
LAGGGDTRGRAPEAANRHQTSEFRPREGASW